MSGPDATPWSFEGADGNLLVGDMWGSPPAQAILLHGGGQTRHAWGSTARRMAERGLSVLNLDLRGHGDSDWQGAGFYAFTDYARDLTAVIGQAPDPVILVGASLGGVTALASSLEVRPLVRAIVLVDVTPSMQAPGIDRILSFMAARPDGFADIEDARRAVRAYQPHRTRQSTEDGLQRNLRQDAAGRLRWHWDPRLLDFATPNWLSKQERVMRSAVASAAVPIVLIRGAESDVVSEDDADSLARLNPLVRRSDVAGARHMVAGDDNELFCTTILAELSDLDLLPAPGSQLTDGERV